MPSLAIVEFEVSQNEKSSEKSPQSRKVSMAERKIEELYPRAPRYSIELGDNPVVRFAPLAKGSKIMHTRIVNISESGMAFLVPYLSAPQSGDTIKVEFNAPNCESMACFAKVMRVQIHRAYFKDAEPQEFKVIAVEFQQLHPKQRQMLSQALTQQLNKKQKEYQRQQMFLKVQWFLKDRIKSLFSFTSKSKAIANLRRINKGDSESE